MRYLARVAMSFALLLAAGSLAWSASRAQDPKETGTITGRVMIQGKPAQGVIVMAIPPGPDVGTVAERLPNPSKFRKAVTDSDGRYRLEAVPTGKYYVGPFAPEFRIFDDGSKEANVREGATVEGIDFALSRRGVMTGKVTDSEGHPVIAAEISWKPVDPKQPEDSGGRSDGRMYFTDDRGIYRIFGLRPGRYIVSAGTSRDHFFRLSPRTTGKVQTYYPGVTDETRAKPVEVTAGTEASGVDISFRDKRFAVSGRVIDAETRAPIANAIVAYSAKTREGGARKRDGDEVSGFSSTNSRGEFRFESLSRGNYKAEAHSTAQLTGGGEFYSDPVNFEVGRANIEKLEIRVRPCATISGVVLVENTGGAALDNLNSFVLIASVTDERGGVARDGSFQIGGLKPGKIKIGSGPVGAQEFSVIRVERNGVEQPDGIDIRPSEQISGVRVIVVPAKCIIRGHVTIQGGPLPVDRSTSSRIELWAVARSPGEPRSDSYERFPIDAKGDFVIKNLTPGTYDVDVGATYLNKEFYEKRVASTKQTVTVIVDTPAQVALVLDVSAKEPDK